MDEKNDDHLIIKETNSNLYRFTFIDLFAGIGGMRLALEKQNGDCVFSSEVNKFCRDTYEQNFGEIPEGDITMISEDSIPDHDMLVAGFPCQPFSLAGISKKKSLGRKTGFEDKTQGTLFFDICRILKKKRPKVFLLENVKNLVSHDKGNTFRTIQESLIELDYSIEYKILDGKNFVPQHRERIFIVGFDKKRYGEVDFRLEEYRRTEKIVLKDILETDVADKYTLSDKLWNYLQEYKERQRNKGNGFGYGIGNPDGIARTLSARYYKDGAEILIEQDGKNPRKLTPRECARLQGFPESFIINNSDNQAYRQFGNSVVSPLIEVVVWQILHKLKDLEKDPREIPDINGIMKVELRQGRLF